MEELNMTINIIVQLIEDLEYEKSRARSPKSKRENAHALKFWRGLFNHLNELKELKSQPNE